MSDVLRHYDAFIDILPYGQYKIMTFTIDYIYLNFDNIKLLTLKHVEKIFYSSY